MVGNECYGELLSSKTAQELLNVLVGVMALTGVPETRLKCELFKFVLSVKLHIPKGALWWKSKEYDEEAAEKMKHLLVHLANEISKYNPELELEVVNFEVNLTECSGFGVDSYGTIH